MKQFQTLSEVEKDDKTLGLTLQYPRDVLEG